MKKNKFKIRAVQLDLARQMETLNFIFAFIDFIAENGYNILVLYLEGRIRTKTFSYPAKIESYSPEEMRRIVKYALEKDIEIIPATQALGHAGQFLQYSEMEPLSELRDTNKVGRWSVPAASHDTFCPSLPESRKFIAQYFTELADIFPAKYFHSGLDEAWHLGFCEKCCANPGGQEGIFTEYIQWLHSFITLKLGKRMLLWDDMFQHYPNALSAIPKDIVLCCWHYDSQISELRWHFGGRDRYDKLEEFANLGFDCLIAPADLTISNSRTFTKLAENKPCLGGLLTMWEKHDSFYYESYPVIAFAGRLWSGKEEKEAFKESLEFVFENSEDVFAKVIKIFMEIPFREWVKDTNPERYLRGKHTHKFFILNDCIELLQKTISENSQKTISPLGKIVMKNISMQMEACNTYAKISEVVYPFFNPLKKPGSGEIAKLDNLIKSLSGLFAKEKLFWEKTRPDIAAPIMDNHHFQLIQNLTSLKSKETTGLICLSLFAPFMPYDIQDTEIFIQFKGSNEWESIINTRLLAYEDEKIYERSFVVPNNRIPVKLKFETWGYARQGLSYLKIVNKMGTFVPHTIEKITGNVLEPESILQDNNYYLMAGEKYTVENFNKNTSMPNKKRHGVEIKFVKINQP